MNFLTSRLSIDIRSAAAFRIAIGCVLLVDVLRRFSTLSAHYSDSGAFPRSLRLQELEMLDATGESSLFYSDGSAIFVGTLLALLAASAFLLIMGRYTRPITVVCWIIYASLLARNPHIRDGGHNMLRMFLFWGMFLPLGARWSWDEEHRPAAERNGDNAYVFSAASIAILIQICIVYWMAAIWKASSAWRDTEQALSQALSIESLTTSLASVVERFPTLLRWGTRFALVLEEVAPVAALFLPVRSSWRAVGAFAMMGFHAGIAAVFSLGIFPLIAACGWLIFLPTPFWDWAEQKFRRKPSDRENSLPTQFIGATLASNLLVSTCLLYVICWNLAPLPVPYFSKLAPESFRSFGVALKLNQRWSFFAPNVLTRDGWYICDATLQDGTRRDLCRHSDEPVSFEKPADIRKTYTNKLWRQYLSHVFHHRRAHLATGYADWLRKEWNEKHPDNPVVDLKLYFMLQDSNYPEDGIEMVLVHPCENIDEQGRGTFEGDTRRNRKLSEVIARQERDTVRGRNVKDS